MRPVIVKRFTTSGLEQYAIFLFRVVIVACEHSTGVHKFLHIFNILVIHFDALLIVHRTFKNRYDFCFGFIQVEFRFCFIHPKLFHLFHSP